MNKAQYDQLYHLLREASNTCDSYELVGIKGLVDHLFGGGDYLRLIQYSELYGEKFLVEPTYNHLVHFGMKPKRIVEFGAGLGWLSRGLAVKFGIADTLTVDKRPWCGIDIHASLESIEGISTVRRQLKDGDLIVMADFLHCVSNPLGILRVFDRFPMAALEYLSGWPDYYRSFVDQVKRYGVAPLDIGQLTSMFNTIPTSKVDIVSINPYILVMSIPAEKGGNK